MKEVKDFLEKSGIQYFSTVGLDKKPKVRPFQFMIENDGKLYFCTSNKKEVFKELKENSWVEICASGKDSSWLRLSGKVQFSDNLDIKRQIQGKSELVKTIYQTPENPDFEIFHLEEAKAVIADFSGEPPKTYTL